MESKKLKTFLISLLFACLVCISPAPDLLAQESPHEEDEQAEIEDAVEESVDEENEDEEEEKENKEEVKDTEKETVQKESESVKKEVTVSVGRGAVLQVLNKITARSSDLKIPAGSEEKFGNLTIKILDCWKSPPTEKPESAVLMKVSETIEGGDPEDIFYGWMFASSPAISALENPVYDIVVLDCKELTAE